MLLIGLGSPALAANDKGPLEKTGTSDGGAVVYGGGTGGDVAIGEKGIWSPSVRSEIAHDLATYISLNGPTDDSAMYAEADRLGLRAAVDAELRSTRLQPAAVTGVPLSLMVNITQEPQIKGYYCGPAAGSEIVKSSKFWGPASRKDGSAISQTTMANANHMRTDINGLTDWGSGLFAAGLNNWLGSAYYQQVGRPSGATFKAAVLSDMMVALPPAVDAVEFAGGVHYNNHPDRLIGHWLAIYFVGDYGDTIGFVDSTAGSVYVNGFGLAQPKFMYPTASFASNFLQSNGMAV